MDRIEAFRATPLFRGMPPARVEELSRLANSLHYEAGETVFRAGERGTSVYVIAEGEVEVLIEAPREEQLILTLAGPGENIGELSLLDDGPRSATVIATRPTELLALRRDDFLGVLHSDREAVLAVLVSLAQRLRETNVRLAELAVLDPPARFARAVLELADRDGVSVPQGTLIDRDVSVGHLAALTALHRNSVERLLRDYQLDDVIHKDGNRITVVRRDVLERAL